jgi:sporulation protein YpjB
MFWNRQVRRFALFTIGAVLFTIASGCGSDEPQPKAETKKAITDVQRITVKQMNEAAESAYQSVNAGDLEQTKERMAQLSVLSTKLSYEGLATVEGIQAVTETITEGMNALNSARPDQVEISMRVASARLAVDALAHKEQPMWLEFQNPLSGDLDRMSAAVSKADDPAASEALARWKGHVSIVRPAIVITRQSTAAVKLDSITAFLDNGIRSADWSGMKQALPNLQQALDDVFANEDRETVSPLLPTPEPPHPILWSLVMGAFIIAVLTYVAWRRYAAEQGVARVKREQDFDAGA